VRVVTTEDKVNKLLYFVVPEKSSTNKNLTNTTFNFPVDLVLQTVRKGDLVPHLEPLEPNDRDGGFKVEG